MRTEADETSRSTWPGDHWRWTAGIDVLTDERSRKAARSLLRLSSLDGIWRIDSRRDGVQLFREPPCSTLSPWSLSSVHRRRRRRHVVASVRARVRLDLNRPGHDDAVSGVVRQRGVAVSGVGRWPRCPDVGLGLALVVLEIVQLLVVLTEEIVVAGRRPWRPPRGEAATDLAAVAARTRRWRPLLRVVQVPEESR